MGVKLYKYLPSKIKKLDNLNGFRKEVKLALLNKTVFRRKFFFTRRDAFKMSLKVTIKQ